VLVEAIPEPHWVTWVAAYHESVECHQWPEDAPSGCCGEPAETPKRGRALRLDVHRGRRGVQAGSEAHAGGRGMRYRESREAPSRLHRPARAPSGGAPPREALKTLPFPPRHCAGMTVDLRNSVFQQPARGIPGLCGGDQSDRGRSGARSKINSLTLYSRTPGICAATCLRTSAGHSARRRGCARLSTVPNCDRLHEIICLTYAKLNSRVL